MFFNSLEFAVFFGVVFGLYLCLPHRAQNRMLLLASYVFYGAWDWRFLGLLWLTTVTDYTVGRLLGATAAPRRRRALITTSIVVQLGILGFFKYAGFFASSLQALTTTFGITLPRFALDVVLPVGISFYTFQSLSYTIDVYRGRVAPARNFLDFALYTSFFPQLVAGPSPVCRFSRRYVFPCKGAGQGSAARTEWRPERQAALSGLSARRWRC